MSLNKMTSSAVILASFWLLGGASATRMNYMYEDIGQNDKVFADNITFESPAKHELDCARQCSERDSCVTFTFNNNNNICRGHGALMTSCSTYLPVLEARSYTKERKARCKKTGVTRVRDPSLGLDMDVFCQDDWMVFQKRQDGTVDFFCNWDEYSTGFGDVYGEYWLGLETLHYITTRGVTYDLRVDMMKLDEANVSALYSNFSVGSAADNYTLHYDSFVGGDAGDVLSVNRGKPFSTLDADNDGGPGINCVVSYHGAWWYVEPSCSHSNLNGGFAVYSLEGIWWLGHGQFHLLKSCQMIIRPTI